MVYKELGWNERVWTLLDFESICAVEGILVSVLAMPWKGLYTVCEDTPCIVLNPDLQGVLQLIVALHELGHHWLHSPYLSFFCKGTLSKSEYEAHRIAAVALIPRYLVERKTLKEIQEEYGYPDDLLWFRKRLYETQKY